MLIIRLKLLEKLKKEPEELEKLEKFFVKLISERHAKKLESRLYLIRPPEELKNPGSSRLLMEVRAIRNKAAGRVEDFPGPVVCNKSRRSSKN